MRISRAGASEYINLGLGSRVSQFGFPNSLGPSQMYRVQLLAPKYVWQCIASSARAAEAKGGVQACAC